jgi:hypothetical protein
LSPAEDYRLRVNEIENWPVGDLEPGAEASKIGFQVVAGREKMSPVRWPTRRLRPVVRMPNKGLSTFLGKPAA